MSNCIPKAILTACAALWASACSVAPADQPGPFSDEQRLIQTIEEEVVLPVGALPMADYSRNYAYGPDGEVRASYIVPFESDYTDQDGCEVDLESSGDSFASRPCTEDEVDKLAEIDRLMAQRDGRAGQSRWLEDYSYLPFMSDGGCLLIEIVFDPKTQEFERVACNGVA